MDKKVEKEEEEVKESEKGTVGDFSDAPRATLGRRKCRTFGG